MSLPGTVLPPRAGLAYGLMGLPLAFVALPLYVHLPHRYAGEFGLPLGLLGGMLLAARLADAVIDPWLGRAVDALYRRPLAALWAVVAVACIGLFGGLVALFLPPAWARAGTWPLLGWMTAALLITYLCFSLLSIAHQAWATRLGGDDGYRSRLVAWREGAGLVGVVLASALPGWFGYPVMLGVFGGALLLGALAWGQAPRVRAVPGSGIEQGHDTWRPWRQPAFRRLLGLFALNGVASAIAATLVVFFIQDRLGAATAQQPQFLGLYFLSAALSMPLWLQAVGRFGLQRCWLAGMLLAIAAFVWALGLRTGDTTAFLVICALTGVALGADLVAPPALLAGVIDAQGDRGHHDGAYLGWWNFATKLNLALAAGLALPLLGWAGYTPGQADAAGLQALSWVYAGLPCVLKALAAAWLWRGLPTHPTLKEALP